jgi:hypothetical protein
MTEEVIEKWLDQLEDEHNEFTYRYIYSAYCRVRSSSGFGIDFEIIRLDNGGFILRSKDSSDPPIELIINSEEERLFFLRYMEKRFSSEKYPTMDDWAARRSQSHMEDRENWVSVPSEKKEETAYDPDSRWREYEPIFVVIIILTICVLLMMLV